MNKEKKKILSRNIAWFFLRIFTFLNGSFSLGWSYFLGKVLGGIAYCIVIPHRRIAVEGLGIAFPKISLKEKKKITRDFFIFMAQSSFELLYLLEKPQGLKNIRVEGREYLDRALESKRGIIIITAHIGNFPLMSLKLAKEGYSVNFVTRPMRDMRVGGYLHNLRTNAGVKTIFSYPRKECVGRIIEALRDNEIVIMQMDQNFGTSGVWVKFFGKLAATPIGPITLAFRTKAVIVPAYICREAKAKHCVRIFPQEELVVTSDKDEATLLNTIKFSRFIEDWVRKFPCQWSWIHRRWKSRPPQELNTMRFKVEKDSQEVGKPM
ncbi:MAG: lysophospholipid acyltransferase family protein [Candidatus Omnitrophota bacterium]|nr:lysophospholipid acyltransferase family protein [Candidatus Omnitrophota bacterium]